MHAATCDRVVLVIDGENKGHNLSRITQDMLYSNLEMSLCILFSFELENYRVHFHLIIRKMFDSIKQTVSTETQ